MIKGLELLLISGLSVAGIFLSIQVLINTRRIKKLEERLK